jgi:hypothetical protein
LKNVTAERDCPDPLLPGKHDVAFCSLLALACHLEAWLANHAQPNGAGARLQFRGSDREDKPIRMNKRHMRNLQSIWKNPEFKVLAAQAHGSIGSDSLRKFASSSPSEPAVNANDVEVHGWGKGGCNG